MMSTQEWIAKLDEARAAINAEIAKLEARRAAVTVVAQAMRRAAEKPKRNRRKRTP